MGIISGYSDDAATTDNDRFLTVASDGSTKNTPASNVNKYVGPGWTIADDTWSYSSYNSTTKIGVINTNSGATSRYSVGQLLKFTQTTLGTKYAVITSLATSAITAEFVNSTVLSNEGITLPFYSAAANPQGFNGIKGSQLANATVTPSKLATGAVADFVNTTETRTNATYGALTTASAVTTTIGANGLALVSIYCGMSNNTNNGSSAMSFAVSGATTQVASEDLAISFRQPVAANANLSAGATFLLTGLNPGSTTFTTQFRSSGADTSSFYTRRISVVPL